MRFAKLPLIAIVSGCVAFAGLSLSANAQEAPPESEFADRLAFATGSRLPLTQTSLEARIEAAGAYPLGSEENPVRVRGPEGTRSYLRRLRCETGETPHTTRVRYRGVGVYGTLVQVYEVQCSQSDPIYVWMDMYHRRDTETDPIPGFDLISAR